MDVKPESPITLEEVLLLHGWILHYKDADVCSLVNPKDKKSRPICIPQNPGPNGLSVGIVQAIQFDARITEDEFSVLLAKVKELQDRSQKL